MSHFLSLVFCPRDLQVASSQEDPHKAALPLFTPAFFPNLLQSFLGCVGRTVCEAVVDQTHFHRNISDFFLKQLIIRGCAEMCQGLCGSESKQGQLYLGPALLPVLHLGQPKPEGFDHEVGVSHVQWPDHPCSQCSLVLQKRDSQQKFPSDIAAFFPSIL